MRRFLYDEYRRQDAAGRDDRAGEIGLCDGDFAPLADVAGTRLEPSAK
jgi:hypothetical protein